MIDSTCEYNKFNPLVSVLMPAYNAALYVRAAVDSVLQQTYQNFELLIYDDCSTDNTVAIIETFTDDRIRLFKKNKNTGYTESLISGITEAKGKYIARMDSDDICDPKRFQKQVEFLELNTNYGIVGSFIETIEVNNRPQRWEYPVEDEDIRIYAMINSPFAHPSVLMRMDVLDKNQLMYSAAYEPCEDYKLWLELLKVTKGKNLPEVLLYYRLHPNQTIQLKRNRLREISNAVRQEVLKDFFNIVLQPADIDNHYYFFNEIGNNDTESIQQKKSWRKNMLKLLKGHKLEKKASLLIENYWLINLRTLIQFKFSFLGFICNKAVLNTFSFQEILRFIGKCFLRYKVVKQV